jgi:endo-1,3(4)-beta-glucanase
MSTMMLMLFVMGSTMFSLRSNSINAATTSYLLSLNRPCYASTVNGGDVPSRATDGDVATQWGAAWNVDNQWIVVDLGATATVDRVVLKWQSVNTYATQYQLQVSDDEINWTHFYSQNNGNGGTRVPDVNGNLYCIEELTGFSPRGRYVRMYAPKCVSGYGVSLYELEIYGTGGINPAPQERVNLALHKTVTVSSTVTPWWASPGQLDPAKAVDGNFSSYWLSDTGNDQWCQVDLGQTQTIGQVNITWDAEFGRIYDIQVSGNGQSWTTVYRQIHGTGEPEQVPMYATGRYVRMKGIAMGRGSGYSIREFQILQYVSGDSQPVYAIPSLPEPETVAVGQGSYLNNDLTLAHPRYPKYVTANVGTPLPSNDWWTSLLYTRLSDGMPALPLMFHYYDNGLGMYYAGDIFTAPNNGGMDTKSNNMDLFINAGNIVKTPEARVDGYGDWSVNVVFSDDQTPKLTSTLIKGSPYVYNTFSDPNSVEITALAITGIFDDTNNSILTADGSSVTADHIGIETSNTNTAPVSIKQIRSYGVFAPPGTVFTRVGGKIKIKLGSGQNYLSIASLPKRSDLNYMYQHAYAFVTNTTVAYKYDANSAMVTTTFTDTIALKRSGFSSNTLMTLFPHHWKYSTASFTSLSYRSARGTQKVLEGNLFSTQVKFNGMTPSFGEPVESASYNRQKMIAYLNTFKASVTKEYWVADPYWQGKKTHPLAMGILIAQQLGEYDTRDQLIGILRKILINWLTYSGSGDYPYYMYYSPDWGTLNGQGGDHGMGINLSDHHFLWAYFTFPAAVLAAYDQSFVTNYGSMVEHLLRDTVNPSKTDPVYPFMRNFDVYEGHSWAGGYGDNQSGNNQESSSEATFAWAGLYLWGLVTGNTPYRDAGIWGFTSEVNAIEQYWFNYDQDNWAADYTPGCVGMVWGSAYTYGTYFSGNPCCIYGIHWLPVTPVLTYLGYRPDAADRIYKKYTADQAAYQAKLASQNPPVVDPEGWFHILWPYQSLSDPQTAVSQWDDTKLPDDERFNAYWFVQNMSAKGYRVTDVWSSNWSGCQVFKKGSQYSAVIWNPTGTTQFVQFRNATGNTGSAYVLAKSTLTVNPFVNSPAPGQAVPDPKPEPGPVLIPGLIEAESYYNNFSCAADYCSEGGLCIGYIDTGDSLEYTVNVTAEGDYPVIYRVLNGGSAPGQLQLKSSLSRGAVLSTANIPVNGGWRNVESTVHLKAGVQTLTVYFSAGGFLLNWMNFGTGQIPATDSTDVALGEKGAASSVAGSNSADYAFDGNESTAWESNSSDPQWIYVDLGANYSVNGVRLIWKGAGAKAYEIQVSSDAADWTEVFSQSNGSGGTENIGFIPVTARYVRMYGLAGNTAAGYALSGFEVYNVTYSPINQALYKTGTASSSVGTNGADYAFDGDPNTRWESKNTDPQWIAVDLGSNCSINGVKLVWETAAAKDYKIQVSTDNVTWTDAYVKSGGAGGTENIGFPAQTGRYVRMYGTARTTGFAYSLWEFEVYGGKNGDNSNSDNLAKNKVAIASSNEDAAYYPANHVTDGNAGTRWSSAASDPQWIYVDLGATLSISKVVLNWEAAYGRAYQIQVSTDAANWDTVWSTTTGTGGIVSATFGATNARYVRMYGTQRGSGYGYSLYELEVY